MPSSPASLQTPPSSETPIFAPQPVNPDPVIRAAYRLPARSPGISVAVNASLGDRSVLVPSPATNQAPRRGSAAQMRRSPSSRSSMNSGSPQPLVAFDPPPHPATSESATTTQPRVKRVTG